MSTPKINFASLNQTLTLQAAIARDFQGLHDLNPEAALALVRQLAAVAGVSADGVAASHNGTRGRQRDDSSRRKVIDFLVARGNEGATKEAILSATGLTAGSLHTVLYDEPGIFESDRNPAGGREKLFRLTPQQWAKEAE